MHLSHIILCVFVLFKASDAVPRRKLNYCLMNNFYFCHDETLARFTQQLNGTGVARTDQEYEEFCHAMRDVMIECTKNYMKRCGTAVSNELYGFIFKQVEKNLDAYCLRGNGSVRETFLRNAECIIHKVKLTKEYRETCIRDFQQEQEMPVDTTKGIAGMMQNICCATNRWLSCIEGMINNQCGQEAADVFPNLIKAIDLVVFNMCQAFPQYKPSNEDTVCEKVLTRLPEDPKGLQSKSLFSAAFSRACPNVGYGIW